MQQNAAHLYHLFTSEYFSLLLHSQLDSLKCRSDGLLKCHGSDTEIDDFAICQVVQLFPPPQSSPSREASRNFIASSQRQSSPGSWSLITGLPSFEYQTGGMSCTEENTLHWRVESSIFFFVYSRNCIWFSIKFKGTKIYFLTLHTQLL